MKRLRPKKLLRLPTKLLPKKPLLLKPPLKKLRLLKKPLLLKLPLKKPRLKRLPKKRLLPKPLLKKLRLLKPAKNRLKAKTLADTRPVTLAAITGAHSLTGEVRLKLFGEGVASLKRHRAFNDFTLTLEKLKDDGKGGAIARFAEVADRTAAEKLRGTALTVPRDTLPPLAEGEYYYTDLLGLPAISTDGEALGTCIAVENFGAGDVLEIQRAPVEGKPGKKFMVPMRAEAVPEWDAERLVITAAFAVED